MIREYLWNCGDGEQMIDAFYHFVDEDGVEFDDYFYMIDLMDEKVPVKFIEEFDALGDYRQDHIDSYEKKLCEYLESSN